MVEKQFKTSKTARVFYNVEEPRAKAKYLWVCLHGYGQLGKFFLRNFDGLNPEDHWVVVPEALSRMYLEGVYGRVGASWMTKEDRLTEIDDYVNYLDGLMSDLRKVAPDLELVVLGFSQGAATAARWVLQGSVVPNHLVLWGSIFPPDLKIETRREYPFKTWMVMGDADEYMNDNRWLENSGIVKDLKIEVELISFSGGHNIPNAVFTNLVERIMEP